MSTHSKVDLSTLGWVKTEIDETLKQARLALESFAENPSDKTRLRFCITHLHQVVGTLLMVELDGAALLAKETEALAEAVVNDKVAPESGVFDALTRGILTLPDYLARLQYGQLDIPLKHIKLINELRVARKVPTISELELFSPDLSIRPPPSDSPKEKASESEFRELAKQLRGPFQSTLLQWLRNAEDKAALRKIADVFEKLHAKASLVALEQLFWVAGGLFEALIDGGLEVTPERKKLFASLDHQLKKIIDGAEKSVLRNSSESLTRAILWEIAHASSQGPRITQLKHAFDLAFLLTGGVQETDTVTDLPAPEALQSVSSALGKEIESAQDLMSTYFDPENHASVSLEPLLESFRKMSGTLDMLNVPILKSLVDELSQTCRALLDNKIANPNSASMPMAEALLMVENSTRDMSRSPAEWKNQIADAIQRLRTLHSPDDGESLPATDGIEVSDGELTESDYKHLLGVVAGEVSNNLVRIEDALEGFAADPAQVQSLDQVPALLSQILGAMQILGQSRAGELVEVTRQYVEDIRRGTLIADSTVMDGLAVCVGTIGAFIEGLRADRPNLEMLIDAAFKDMDNALATRQTLKRDPGLLIDGIRMSLESWLDDLENDPARETLAQQLSDLSQLAREQGQRKIELFSAEMNKLLALVADDPTRVTQEITDTLKQSFTAVSALAGRRLIVRRDSRATPNRPAADFDDEVPAPKYAETAERTRAVPSKPAARPAAPERQTAADEEFDDEIMDIFIEDARDVIENIRNKLGVWREDTANQNALADLRRGFHTIKGSGRMVGATEIAELAWSVENVLNKVREGKIAPSPAIIDLLDQAEETFPKMVDALADRSPHGVELESLRQFAFALAEPGAVPPKIPRKKAAASATETERRATPGPGSDVKSRAPQKKTADLPKLDGALLEIFTSEAQNNLANIRQQISSCRETGGACFVSETLYRAVHTLQGNARSLTLEAMSEPCSVIEKLLHTLKTENVPLNEVHLELVTRFESVVTELVELMNRGETSSGILRQRFAELSRDTHAVIEYIEEPDPSLDRNPMPSVRIPAREVATPPPAPAKITPPPSLPPDTGIAPERAPPFSSTSPESIPEQIDPELLDIFQEEATDILNTIEEALTRWRIRPDDRALVPELKRSLHTLKGGARMAGAMTMGELSHNTETLLRNTEEGKVDVGAGLFDLLDEVHDFLMIMLGHARRNRPAPDITDLNARVLALSSGRPVTDVSVTAREPKPVAAVPDNTADRVSVDEPVVETAASDENKQSAAMPAALNTGTDFQEHRQPPEDDDRQQWPEMMERRGQVRVNTSLLNDLVNYAGEVSISRSRMEQQIFSFRDNLSELSRNITRFREQIRELEIQSESQILYRMEQEAGVENHEEDFDPLEFDRYSRLQQLSRSLAESLHDLGTIQNSLGNFAGEAEAVLQQQARINTDLQEGLMRTRMVSFMTQAARLRHIVRQTGRELGKRAELNLDGAEVEIDRNVLDRMIGPFEHMIRNSIDHGIEEESVRRQKNKPAVGRITIACSQEGPEVIIRLSDDGAGLNIQAIRAKAIERGLMSPEADLTEEELIQFILMSGFSTAEKITHLSGRGVGMDVVHSEVKQLGGSMSVDSEADMGTTFIIRLPLTLSIMQALMVYVGDQLFALPLGSVVNIIEFPFEKVANLAVGKNPLLSHDGKVYPYMSLGQRLGLTSTPRNIKKVPVMIARAGTREVAIQIDGLGGTREVVIKSIGPQLSEIKGLAGATILGDGRVVLILDIPALWFREDIIHFEHHPVAKPAAEIRERPVIMVVDDSLTVRKVTSKHLQKRGMDVMVAKDGIDAVEQLRDRIPDLMLVDIEMPRMDGYELTTRVRSDENLKQIPIIIITSRAGSKHRQKAIDLGVDIYMSKPYQEEELFKNIDNLLERLQER